MLFRIVRICSSLFKSNYLKNEKVFLSFLFHLWNLHQVLNIFKKRKIVIANVFPNFQTVKDLVRPLSKKCPFRTWFDSQHVKVSQTLVKSSREQFYQIYPSLWEKIIWKMSRLSQFEISGEFLNSWTPDDKYAVPAAENLRFPIQMQLSSKENIFSRFFVQFMESTSNFKHFLSEELRHTSCISEITNCQRLG